MEGSKKEREGGTTEERKYLRIVLILARPGSLNSDIEELVVPDKRSNAMLGTRLVVGVEDRLLVVHAVLRLQRPERLLSCSLDDGLGGILHSIDDGLGISWSRGVHRSTDHDSGARTANHRLGGRSGGLN